MENPPDLKRLNIDPSTQDSDEELIRRLIRLVIGLVLVGQDSLRRQLPIWEDHAARYLEELAEREQIPGENGTTEVGTAANRPPAIPQTAWFPKEWEYRLVGLAFETPNYLKSGLRGLLKVPQKAWRLTTPLRLPLELFGVTDFTRDWAEGFLDRLQIDMEHLQEIGQQEAEASRALGQTAASETLDALLRRLAENPEVQELVQYQTTSLTSEVVEEIRERTVSADNLLEALVRRLLRQKPRLPEKMIVTPAIEDQRKQEW
jgi:hypothetical protein